MKWYVICFALADICCMAILYHTFILQLNSLTSSTEVLSGLMFFSRSLFVLTYLSLLTSAIFHILKARVGIIIYFLQIPSRFIFSLFSFGFISYIDFDTQPIWFSKFLIATIIFLEFIRIFISYKFYKKTLLGYN